MKDVLGRDTSTSTNESVSAVVALGVRPKTSRFDALTVLNPTSSLDVATTPVASLGASEGLRGAWGGFLAAHGQAWSIYLDRRSGAPLPGKSCPAPHLGSENYTWPPRPL